MRRLAALLPSCVVLLIWPLLLAALTHDDQASPAAKALHALFAVAWDAQMQEDPIRASTLGDRRWNDRWPEVGLEAAARRYALAVDTLARLKTIDRARLSPADQLNYDLFMREYDLRVEEHQYRWHLIPLDQREGIQTRAELADLLPFDTIKDYQDWLQRLRAFPAFMDGTIEVMREGIRARLVHPQVIVRRIQAQVDKHLVVVPETSPFYKPFTRFPPSVPEATRLELTRAARAAISSAVLPAFARFQRFLANEYLPAAFDPVGIWQTPGGDRAYAFFARKHTTTTLTPQQIHEVGLAEVKRIRIQMQAIMTTMEFRGTLTDYFTFLRSDPRFYYRTPEELLSAYRAIAKRIDPALVKVFRTLPRTPYGVEPIAALAAPDTTTAYYQEPAADGSRAGTYFVNLYKPETRPKYEMMALSLHEAVPGHHLQIALAMEQGELPRFRRHAGDTAFVEGWALYAESLGDEMGLYDDPLMKFGQLTYEMWRAVRLVVDTGIHAMRWDRQRAIDFFMDHAAKSEADIVNEIDRYIAWPGQALAYKIGELKIKELRARAARELGDRFDLRDFHDLVLRNGALPLEVLEAGVETWIASRRG